MTHLHNSPQSASSQDQSSTVFSQLSQLTSIESAVDRRRTSSPGSRSLECSPRVSPLSMQSSFSDSVADRQRYANKRNLTTNDKSYRQSDLVQTTPIRPLSERSSRVGETCSVPPRIVPRNRILSDEERNLNREQIVQQLQIWTQKQKDRNRSESEEDGRSVISQGGASVASDGSHGNGSVVSDALSSDAAGASGCDSGVTSDTNDSPRVQVVPVRPVVTKGDGDVPPRLSASKANGDTSSMDRPSKSMVWQLRQNQSQNGNNATSSQEQGKGQSQNSNNASVS